MINQTTNQMSILPAGGLESGPEVATQATLTRLAVIQEKPWVQPIRWL